MNASRSLGVLIPTRNSAALLPRYLEALEVWLDMATEVVVVDSFSTDGTLELLKTRLRHPHVQFLSHPPGLYASWNFGIQHLQSEYTYIATVCDTITRAGMEKLLATALLHQSDVVVSKPNLHKLDGRPVEIKWPIDDVIQALGIRSPRTLRRLEAVVFAFFHAASALTGSCASDLFRTSCLKRYPFPTGVGMVADGAWSTLHAAEVTWTVVSEKFSTFAIHPTFATAEDCLRGQKMKGADQILGEAVKEWQRSNLVTETDLERLGWKEGFRLQRRFVENRAALDRCRKNKFPWILNPRAWLLRTQRQRARARLHSWKMNALCAAGEHERTRPCEGG
ncbi:MAG: glycosyltransferase family A protein [Verrucomicrobiota bacterium]